jgi:superfamily I DNA and RNA helicase
MQKISSYFYSQATKNTINAYFLEKLQEYADNNKRLIYVLDKPLTDQKYSYTYSQALIVLSPKSKIAIIDYGVNSNIFQDFVEDVLEDIGFISDKYLYKDVVGRPRQWRKNLLDGERKLNSVIDIEIFFNELAVVDELEKKKIDLLISLFIGSINDIERVKESVPSTLLDKVKQKIQLFDGDQTRFVYQKPEIGKKRITIQGLSGTGKTELLLHKLKDLYITENSSSIFFTCHNKILADSLKKRIPSFFNFMKVEQQIEWEKRLWCANAWGSRSLPNSGAYRYICAFYNIPFYTFSYDRTFGEICAIAINEIKSKYQETEWKYAFTYMFIDESQDFDPKFFELCELVSEKNVYVAGDIFQSIFDETISSSIEPDFLLGKCYRTDPKTLMFAHALGMGLFETNKLRWLDKKEWEGCGYSVEIVGDKYHLSREPLRRFEDLDEAFESINIIEIENRYSETIVELIENIKRENETVLPDDIGIILLDNGEEIYKLADALEVKIQSDLNWNVNKAYETKEKQANAVLISNRNNVKGLEFPFVICVTKAITNDSSYRNSLYTMLTRSFIKSYLVIPNNGKSGLTEEMKNGLKEIVSNQIMIIQEPSDSEKEIIKTSFDTRFKKQSYYDIMINIFKQLKIDRKYHDILLNTGERYNMQESDEKTLINFVSDNFQYIKL